MSGANNTSEPRTPPALTQQWREEAEALRKFADGYSLSKNATLHDCADELDARDAALREQVEQVIAEIDGDLRQSDESEKGCGGRWIQTQIYARMKMYRDTLTSLASQIGGR